MQRGKTIFTALIVGLCVSVGTAAAPTLTFTFKDVHSFKAAQETDSYGINNAGVIVGDYIDSAGVQHGMILNGTKVTKADHPNCLARPERRARHSMPSIPRVSLRAGVDRGRR